MTMPNTETRGSRGEPAGQQSLPRAEREDSGGAREQIREVKDQVVGQAKNTLQQARDRASSSLLESKSQVAGQFGAMADALKRTTEHLRSEDQQRVAGLTASLARQLDQVAAYLWSKDARAMRSDLENLARRQPAIVMGGALVLGLIGARFLKSSQREKRVSGGGQFGNGSSGRGYQGGGYAGS